MSQNNGLLNMKRSTREGSCMVSQKAKAEDRTTHRRLLSPGQSTVSVLVPEENCGGMRDLAAREEYQ